MSDDEIAPHLTMSCLFFLGTGIREGGQQSRGGCIRQEAWLLICRDEREGECGRRAGL